VFVHRLLSALVGIPVGIFLVWQGGLWLAGFVVILGVIAFQEYHATLRIRRVEALREIGFPASAALILGAYFFGGPELLLFTQGVLALAVVSSLAFHLFAPIEGSRTMSAAATLLGVVYIGFLFTFTVLVREMVGPTRTGLPFGLHLFLLAWLATMAADTVAYAVGKALGKRKLCPAVSPGKTVEGAIGGVLGSMAFALPLGIWAGFPAGHAIALGALIAVAGLIGDLSKSIIKRDVGVKDFGTLIPGHGGVLDRFDSLLVSMPVAYFYAIAFLR
jgi:phosphatidate cytidylyltransferase